MTWNHLANVATLSMLISLPVSIPLSTVSLTEVSVSSVAMALTKSTKRNSQVTKLTDIVTSAIALFETSVSKALKDLKIDKCLTCFRCYTTNRLIICSMLIVR